MATATLTGVWNVAVGSYQLATLGIERANTVYEFPRPVPPAKQAVDENLRAARQGERTSRGSLRQASSAAFTGDLIPISGETGNEGSAARSWAL